MQAVCIVLVHAYVCVSVYAYLCVYVRVGGWGGGEHLTCSPWAGEFEHGISQCLCQKRPMSVSKETYVCVKRDLCLCHKRGGFEHGISQTQLHHK